MNARQITIVSTKDQSKYVINSTAETLGELKRDLDNAGIDYEGMIFYSGLTKTEHIDNDSRLPKDVQWKGQVTNNLVFMLTYPKNKIKNGNDMTNRADIYKYIIDNNYQEDIKKKYGKPYTNCTTADLANFVNNKVKRPTKKTTTKNTSNKSCTKTSATMTVNRLTNILLTKGVITQNDIDGKPNTDVTFSDSDIEDIFADML